MPKKILVVDDEVDIANMVQMRLESQGYTVIQANDGEAALDKIKKENPDLVLLDVMVPPPNGFQLCRMLKDEPLYRNIPIILLTAKSTESDKFWGQESGADEYVTKPYDAADLLKKIKKLLEKQK
ncbi:MAG: response regulator [Candidatus Omnitrophica bacterium]|nr:response regulator [Candidatus Omnitrophota bacterium]